MARVKEATIKAFCRIIVLPNGAQVLVKRVISEYDFTADELLVVTQIRGVEGSIKLAFDSEASLQRAFDEYSDIKALGFWRSINRMVK